MNNILKKSVNNLTKDFGNILLLTLIQAAIIYVIQRIFTINSLEMRVVILSGGLISTLIISIISDYVNTEVYLAFKEKRKVRPFGIFKLFSEYDADLLKISVIKNVKIFLWYLLFIIPGIYKNFEYNRVLVAKVDNYNLETKECFKKSREDMDGRKAELFGYNLMVSIPLIVTYIIIAIFVTSFISKLISGNLDPSFFTGSLLNIILMAILFVLVSFISQLFLVSLSGTFNAELTRYLGGDEKIEEELNFIDVENIEDIEDIKKENDDEI